MKCSSSDEGYANKFNREAVALCSPGREPGVSRVITTTSPRRGDVKEITNSEPVSVFMKEMVFDVAPSELKIVATRTPSLRSGLHNAAASRLNRT